MRISSDIQKNPKIMLSQKRLFPILLRIIQGRKIVYVLMKYPRTLILMMLVFYTGLKRSIL
ncbi:hypothetical protein C484_14678 [Natrialba taiwanensis DSM 12281]|uniref:Uncharacterized protein n=1 Tax=Natrialba taiwanensis DSM 12281 TaxID=1230458 RepID=L9ZR58_9EURY|nr:hypothetical protein C484_14678 [Natrialba taiwanensis DSM 12281]